MKKLFSILSIFLMLFVFTSCGSKDDKKTNKEYSMVTPLGTPYMGVAGLLDNSKYNIDTVTGADLITAELQSHEKDIVIAPVATALKLSSKGALKYKFVSTITANNIYLVSRRNDSLSDLTVLNEKNILAFGQGATPDVTLKAFLNKNNITSTIDYEQSSQSVITKFITNTENPNEVTNNTPKYVLMSEPNITSMIIKYNIEVNTLDICSDLEIDIPQAGLFVNDNLEKKQVEEIIEDFNKNSKLMNDDINGYIEKIVSLDKTQQLKQPILSKITSSFNCYKRNAKEDVESFITMVNTYNPSFFNGASINESFYY